MEFLEIAIYLHSHSNNNQINNTMQNKPDITFDEFYQMIHTKLMNLIAEHGLSYSEILYVTGISSSTYTKLRNNNETVRVETICNAYDKLIEHITKNNK